MGSLTALCLVFGSFFIVSHTTEMFMSCCTIWGPLWFVFGIGVAYCLWVTAEECLCYGKICWMSTSIKWDEGAVQVPFFRLTMLGFARFCLTSSNKLWANVCREKYFWKSDWETLTTCWTPNYTNCLVFFFNLCHTTMMFLTITLFFGWTIWGPH